MRSGGCFLLRLKTKYEEQNSVWKPFNFLRLFKENLHPSFFEDCFILIQHRSLGGKYQSKKNIFPQLHANGSPFVPGHSGQPWCNSASVIYPSDQVLSLFSLGWLIGSMFLFSLSPIGRRKPEKTGPSSFQGGLANFETILTEQLFIPFLDASYANQLFCAIVRMGEYFKGGKVKKCLKLINTSACKGLFNCYSDRRC